MTDPKPPGGRLPAPPPEPEARERVVDALTRHFADDRISAEDLETRLERVYRATTAAQLEAVVADLPSTLPVAASSAVPDVGAPQRISALFSAQEQRVTGVVPRELELHARMGYVELDLTHATFEPGLTAIDVRALMGYVQIRLPPGVRVECRGRALFGYFSLRGAAGSGAEDSPRIVRITGRAVFGYAECLAGRGKAALPPGDRDR
jgi:hypothetical protein